MLNHTDQNIHPIFSSRLLLMVIGNLRSYCNSPGSNLIFYTSILHFVFLGRFYDSTNEQD